MAAGFLVAVALRLAAAQFLDPECANGDDAAELQLRNEAFSILHGEAKKAVHVQDVAKARRTLSNAIAELRELGPGPNVGSALVSLETFSLDLRTNGLRAEPIAPVATKIAEYVWKELAGAGAHAAQGRPLVRFETSQNKDINARAVSGETSISGSERAVWLLLTDETLRSGRFVEVLYTLFHEIVCHAFQAVGSSFPEDVGADCAWTEGWMDTIARDMACDWVSDSRSPSPMSPESARMTIMSSHESRYGGLSDPVIKAMRRQAREACVGFPRLLVKHNSKMTKSASEHKARAFSFALNTHSLITRRQLKTIGDNLRKAIGRAELHSIQSEAVSACLDFVEDRNLTRFTGRLEHLEL